MAIFLKRGFAFNETAFLRGGESTAIFPTGCTPFWTQTQKTRAPVWDLTQTWSMTVTGHVLQASATLIVKVALKVTLNPALAKYIHSKPQICHGTYRIKFTLGLLNLPAHIYQLSLAETLPCACSPPGHAEMPVGAPEAHLQSPRSCWSSLSPSPKPDLLPAGPSFMRQHWRALLPIPEDAPGKQEQFMYFRLEDRALKTR